MRDQTIIILTMMACFAVAVRAAELAPPVTTATTVSTAATTQPSISLSVVTEDGQKQVRATVKLNDRPLENAKVVFSVRRTFGNLILGTDTTLDDGTAQAKFPERLPGGPTGELHLLAEVKATPQYTTAKSETVVAGGIVVTPAPDPFPRAFWRRTAPFPLVASIVVLLAGVWTTYAFVVSQILAIARQEPSDGKE